jgi:N-acetylmuramoyl-L-alanine amidase
VETFYALEKVLPSQERDAPLGTVWQQLWKPTSGEAVRETNVPRPDMGEEFAMTIQSSVVRTTGLTDRGIKARDLSVVRNTRCPAVLVEGGFVNNPAEARKLQSPQFRQKLAEGIGEGILSYLQTRGLLSGVRPTTLAVLPSQ